MRRRVLVWLHASRYVWTAFSAALLCLVPSIAQAQFTCFPTCAANDGKLLALPGGAMAESFGSKTFRARISVPASIPTVEVAIFDGDTGASDGQAPHWDGGTAPLTFEVFTDPDGDGQGNVLVYSVSGAQMPDNAWHTVSLPHDGRAQIASGHAYAYVLVIRNPDVTPRSWSAFKLRVPETSSLRVPPQMLSFVAPLNGTAEARVLYPAYPALQPTTYDGAWELTFEVPTGRSDVTVWDGDMDFGASDCTTRDADDPDTPNGVPAFASGTLAVNEGAAQAGSGVPACAGGARPSGDPPDDDKTAGGGLQRRSPSVFTELFDPLGGIYWNMNPSGDREWERFTVSSARCDRSEMDFCAGEIPAGLWRLRVVGMDAGNVNSVYVPFDIVPGGRTLRIQTVTNTSAHGGATFTGTIDPDPLGGEFSLALPSNGSTSAAVARTVGTTALTVTQEASAEWSVLGYLVLADPAGTLACPVDGAYGGTTASVPSGAGRYLVCVKNKFDGPLALRLVRVQKVTASASHPTEVLYGSILPGGPTTGSFAVQLPTNSSHSDVANRMVTNRLQTIRDYPAPNGWTHIGFLVKHDPHGNARCLVADPYDAKEAIVPADSENYLVCTRSDFTASVAARPLRIQAMTSSSTHAATTLSGSLSPGGPDGSTFVLELNANAPSTNVVLRSATPQTQTMTVHVPSGWTLGGFVVKPDPNGTAACSLSDSYRGTSATVPSGSASHLVCIRLEGGGGPGPAPAGQMRMTVPRATGAPALDGRVNTDEWRDAVAVTGIVNQFDGLAAPRQATFWMKYDGNFVYIAQRSTLLPNELAHGPVQFPLWFPEEDNVVAFSLAPRPQTPAGTASHFQFRANPRGNRWHQEVRWENQGYKVRYPQNIWWQANWSAANWTNGDQTVWESEYAIPLSAIRGTPVPDGSEWRVLLARDYPGNDQNAIVQSNDWRFGPANRHWGAAVYDNYRLENRYAAATMASGAPAVQVLGLGNLAAGQLNGDVAVYNTGGSTAQLTVSAAVRSGQTVVHQEQHPLTVSAGQRRTLVLGPKTFPAGEYLLTVEAKTQSGQVLYRQDVPFRPDYAAERGPAVPTVFFVGAHKEGDYLYAHMPMYNPIRNTLTAKMRLYRLPGESQARRADVTVRRQGERTPFFTMTMPPFDGDGITETTKPLPPLQPGVYEATGSVYDDSGRLLGRSRDIFVRYDHAAELPWLNNTIGKSTAVLPPWTPIQTRDGGRILEPWGRRYEVDGSGFFKSVVSGGESILAAPVRLEIVGNGGVVSLSAPAQPTTINAAAHEVRYQGRLDGGGWSVTNDVTLEYDGYARFAVTLAPQGAQQVQAVRLVIPLSNDVASHLHAMAQSSESTSSIAVPSGTGLLWHSGHSRLPYRNFLTAGNFKPFIWVGNGHRGLAFMADNDQGWVPDDTLNRSAQELRRTATGVELVLNLVARPFTFDGPRQVVFSLQATPIRPLRPDFRRRVMRLSNTTTFTGLEGDGISEDGVYGLGYNTPGPAFPLDWDKNRRFQLDAEARGKIYTPFQVSNQWQSVLEVEDPRAPGLQGANVYGYILPEISASWSFADAVMHPVDADYRLWRYDRWIRESGISGMYLDSAYPTLGTNVAAGQGYVLDLPDRPHLDGKVQPGYMLTGFREFLKRLRTVFVQHGKDPAIIVHATDSTVISAYAFADFMVDGEIPRMRPNTAFSEVWPREELQATHPSQKWGLPIFFISSINPPSRFAAARHRENMHGYLMLHDADIWETHYFWGGYTSGGLDVSQPADFLPYWNPQVRSAIRSPHPDVLVSAWRQGNSVFLLAFNHSWNQANGVKLQVDLQALGVASAGQTVTNVVDIATVGSRPPLGVTTSGPRATIDVSVEPQFWRAIRIDFR